MIKNLVSIIIPTFNCREWICDAIESSLNQTYKYCEIIVIDDGSTDSTASIIASRYKHRITYIYQQNMGLSAARNRGIDAANGEYIQFLDSDDIITADKIEIQVNALKNVHGYGVSYSDYCSIDINNNSILERRYLSPKTNNGSFFYSLVTDWETRFSVPVHCFLFKSSLFLDHNIKFDVSLPNHEDWDCWVRVFSLNPKVVYVDAKLAIYRIKSSSMCSNRALMRYGFLESLNKYLQKYPNEPEILALLINKRNEIEQCYRDVSAEDIRSTAMQMAAKSELQRMPVVEATSSEVTSPRLIAFHLPQFHSIPENDEWWGKGFTEWTNVSKATPYFPGHYQPHVPADLGYYDLSDPSVMKAQAALAKEYGIHGFCFYHYWFNGKLLLETPLHQMLKSGEPDFPFCLCWANEDWTKAWDGRSGDVLIGQNYSDADDTRHFYYLLNFFEDTRYMRVNGKPLFLVYRANRLPDPVKTTTTWRQLARKMGIGELFLCRVESFTDEHTNPQTLGFDAAVEFQPDWRELEKKLSGEEFGDHAVYEYSDVVQKMLTKPNPSYSRFPCVTPSWDNSARRKSNATIFINPSPDAYGRWLKESIRKILANTPDERMVFINAWNEWGEGNHLEPDVKYGRSYLEATKAALEKTDPSVADDTNKTWDLESSYQYVASIIIPVFNNVDYTRNCIQALIHTTQNIHCEFIIIDNASTDDTKKYLYGLSGDIRVITNPENLGYTIACNQGAQAASGELLVFLNNDTIPQDGWLKSLINTVEADGQIGAVGAKLIYPDGTLQEAGAIVFSDGSALNFGRGEDPAKPLYNRICEVDYCSGACLLIPHKVYKELDGFDEMYAPAYYEETDFCFKLREHGYKVIYQPQSHVVHYGSVTAGLDPSGPLRKYLAINKVKFVQKWVHKLSSHSLAPAGGGKAPATADRNAVHIALPSLPKNIDKISKLVDGIPHMSFAQGRLITDIILENKFQSILELGFRHGVSTCYMAGALDELKGGNITTIDLIGARQAIPNVESLLSTLSLTRYVTVYYEPTSYIWRLMKMIEESPLPRFDFCFIDGAHNWSTDGFAFFLVDRLLKPGGLIVFDGLDWTYESSPTNKNLDYVKRMPTDERCTPQIRNVFELLVKPHPSYCDIIEAHGWAYARKIRG
jgi:GT2 family glycosyltransferase/predicted O-methyltransferase YrrM